MLKTTIVAMTLLGCDCDAKQCEYVSDAPGQWATGGECEAAMKRAVLSNSRLDYPLVTGMCRTIELDVVAAVSAPVEAKIETIETASVEAGSSNLVFRRTADGYAAVMSGMAGARAAIVTRTIGAAQSIGPMAAKIGGSLPAF
jgi:hypothetical protein